MSSHRLSGARAPAVQYVLDVLAHLSSSCLPVDARHQQLVIVGVDVADRRRNGQPYGVRIERPPSCASPDPAAAARGRMPRDGLGPADGAAREQRTDRGGKLGREIHVLIGSSCLVPLQPRRPFSRRPSSRRHYMSRGGASGRPALGTAQCRGPERRRSAGAVNTPAPHSRLPQSQRLRHGGGVGACDSL